MIRGDTVRRSSKVSLSITRPFDSRSVYGECLAWCSSRVDTPHPLAISPADNRRGSNIYPSLQVSDEDPKVLDKRV